MPTKNIKYEHKSHDIEFRNLLAGKNHLDCRPHLHRELELVYMVEGESIAYSDSVKCVIRSGDVFLTFPNQIHSYEAYTTEKYLLFIIKPDLMPELMETFNAGVPTSPILRSAGDDPRIQQLFYLLGQSCEQKKSGGYGATLRRGLLLALFSELLSRMEITRPQVGDSETLRAIVSYCSRNFSENLSLSVLEEKLHLNKYYISHLFSGKLGMRFNDYVNSLRISEACRLLVNSDMNITRISEQVGFNTLRTFNRAFYKQIGVSPSQYRKSDPLTRHDL